MRLSNLLPVLLLSGTALGGSPGNKPAAGPASCLCSCAAAFATCHAVGHSMSIFTFGFTSVIALASCHPIFIACEAACLTGVAVYSSR
jgi:hypothetical protein